MRKFSPRPALERNLKRMYFRLLFLLLCLFPTMRGAEIDELMLQVSAAETVQHSRRALQLLQQADKLRPDDVLILQKIARQYSDLVLEQPSLEEKKRYAQTALEYSQRAFALNPKDPVSILSLAVCHGKLALYGDTRTKAQYSRLVQEEAAQALALDPNYAWAHHVLGRWHYEMATLDASSRFFLKLFYRALPAASVSESIQHLQRATELEPGELNHWLELGFAYLAAGKPQKARTQWVNGLQLPSRGAQDESAKQRARDALAKLN